MIHGTIRPSAPPRAAEPARKRAPRQSPHAAAVDAACDAVALRPRSDLRSAFLEHLRFVADALEAVERARRCGCYRQAEEEALRLCLGGAP